MNLKLTNPFTISFRFELCVFLSVFVFFAGTGCKKSSNPVPKKAADVYVSGYITALNNNNVAAYWKNGVITVIGDSTVFSIATGIALNGQDVYVSGAAISATGNFIATVWKNGVPTKLTNGAESAEATAVTINGSDIYVAGYATNNVGVISAAYWKNNMPVYLTGTVAQAITINGGDVYAAGSSTHLNGVTGGYVNLTTYWKNGVATILPNPLPGFINGFADGIAVSGNDVYMVGYDDQGEYWKNGTAMPLTGGQGANPWAIALSGNDVYIAGQVNNANNFFVATLWKNGTAAPLSDGTSNAVAFSITINGSDVYTAGYTSKGNKPIPTYWQNSRPVSFKYIGSLTGIAVVQQ